MQAWEENLFLFLEMFLADAAGRAGPVIGNFFKRSAGGYTCIRIACFRVINPTAHYTDISWHVWLGKGIGWCVHNIDAALRVPKARSKCSSTQRKKGVAFNGTTTLRADFPRTRKWEDNGLASVKCWKTNNHQPGILHPTKTLFESESKIETLRANGNETTHHPHTWTKKKY